VLAWFCPGGATAAAPVAGPCPEAVDPVGVAPWAVELEVVVVLEAPVFEAPVFDVEPVALAGEAAAVGLEAGVLAVEAAPAGVAPGAPLVEPPKPAADAEAASCALSWAANPAGSGAWMFAIARPTFPPCWAERNATPVGAGMTIPIPAASRSIRWSSARLATLA
jgi:hypothetical protein